MTAGDECGNRLTHVVGLRPSAGAKSASCGKLSLRSFWLGNRPSAERGAGRRDHGAGRTGGSPTTGLHACARCQWLDRCGERRAPFGRNVLHGFPEFAFVAQAGPVTADHDRALEDRGFRHRSLGQHRIARGRTVPTNRSFAQGGRVFRKIRQEGRRLPAR
jgi:hypothetical protein